MLAWTIYISFLGVAVLMGLPRGNARAARIVALADVYDALSSERCYKQAWHERRVLDTIRAESGGHFDPELVEISFERLDEVREIRAAHPG